MYTLKRRGGNTNPCGTPFFRRRSLLGLLSLMVRVKLLFRTSSMIIRTMCLSGTSLSSFQARPLVPDSVISNCQIDKHGTNLLFYLKNILNVLRKQNDLIYGRLSVSKSSLFLWEQEIDYWFDAIVDRSFEDLVGDAEQKDATVALWVLYRF